MSRNFAEQKFQIQATQLIRLQYPQAILMAIPNGGFILQPKTVALLKAMGLEPGAPDWLLVWPGGFGFIEFKSKKGSLSPVQKALIGRLREAGARVALVRGPDGLLAALKLWSVPKGLARDAA